MNKLNEKDEAFLRVGVTYAVFQEIGFEPATTSRLPAILHNIRPSGNTSMRDAVLQSALLLIELGKLMQKIGTHDIWNIVNIVLTDGDDTSSKNHIDETCEAMLSIGAHLPIKNLKTFFIGVDLQPNSKAAIEIAAMVISGDKNTEYMNVNDAKIEEVFEKIKISLRILQITQAVAAQNDQGTFVAVRQQIKQVLLAEKQFFVVLFTLDMSGSMSGYRWAKVCNSVNKFVQFLGPEDLVCGIAFNENVSILTRPFKTNAPPPPPPMRPIQYYDNRMPQNYYGPPVGYGNMNPMPPNYYGPPVVHAKVRCDGCYMDPVMGKRYKCRVCPDFDYCENCMKKYGAQHRHNFMMFRAPNSPPEDADVVLNDCEGFCCTIF